MKKYIYSGEWQDDSGTSSFIRSGAWSRRDRTDGSIAGKNDMTFECLPNLAKRE